MKIFSKILILLAYLLSLVTPVSAQVKTDVDFENMVNSLLDFTVPIISVEDYKSLNSKHYILDAREAIEYNVSHIPGATWIGYDDFLLSNIPSEISKDDTIVVYCSVGYRSEKVSEKLISAGYNKVYNLYGSIFEWVNQGNPVVNNENQEVWQLHTYNKKWAKWLINTAYKKTW